MEIQQIIEGSNVVVKTITDLATFVSQKQQHLNSIARQIDMLQKQQEKILSDLQSLLTENNVSA